MNIYPPALNRFKNRITWDCLDKNLLKKHLRISVEEDLGGKFKDKKKWELDISTKICNLTSNGSAFIVSRESMILCGLLLIPLILEAFETEDIKFNTSFKDGDFITNDQIIGELQGAEKEILLVERCILNFLQRLSGVASKTMQFVRKIERFGVGLLDTRKTTPGLRLLEKYASACGGSFNHRIGLFDRILIKDNHLAAVGATRDRDLEAFLRTIIQNKKPGQIIEVEIDDLTQLKPAIQAGVDALLLDNFSPESVKQAVEDAQEKVVIEASGGISETSIVEYAKSQPHFISTGAPVHSGRWVDIGLDWK